MGCFIACFGLKKKIKRVKSRNRRSSGEKNHGSYVPLNSEDVPLIKLLDDSPEKNIPSDSDFKEKPKESSRLKIKKKVSFNLNVKAYEPIQNEDDTTSLYLSEGEETTKWEFDTEETRMDWLKHEEDSISSTIRSFPQNNRYQNCRDGYDDEDEELKFEENDLYLDDIEDTDEDNEDGYYSSESDDELDKESDFQVVDDGESEERISSFEQILALKNKELEGIKTSYGIRDRSKYVSSVLNPVENLTQWKAVKAKAAPLKRQKENIVFENQERKESSNIKHDDSDFFSFRNTKSSNVLLNPGQSIAVDASLSNWLGSVEMETNTKKSIMGAQAV